MAHNGGAARQPVEGRSDVSAGRVQYRYSAINDVALSSCSSEPSIP